MYGQQFAPYTGCNTGAPFYPQANYALAPYYSHAMTGADPVDTRTTMQKIKDFGEAPTFGVKRKYLGAAAVGVGVIALLAAKGVL